MCPGQHGAFGVREAHGRHQVDQHAEEIQVTELAATREGGQQECPEQRTESFHAGQYADVERRQPTASISSQRAVAVQAPTSHRRRNCASASSGLAVEPPILKGRAKPLRQGPAVVQQLDAREHRSAIRSGSRVARFEPSAAA